MKQIAPSLGASTYTQTPAQIQNIPGGANAPFQQVLLRAPGVVEDSFGQEHVRGEHANLTYRINGVLLPQPLSGRFRHRSWTRGSSIRVTLIDWQFAGRSLDFTLLASWTCRPNPATR